MSETGREKEDLVQDESPLPKPGAANPDERAVLDDNAPAFTPAVEQSGEPAPGLLELIYGVLFDPVQTFRRIAPDPPILLTVIIVTIVNATTGLMSVFTFQSVAPRSIPELEALFFVLVPLLALIGFFLWYLKWVGYGSVLHLVAQLFGGVNGPKATLTVYGLATLPGLLLLPVEALIVIAGLGDTAAARLIGPSGLAVFVWSLVLLVLGLREMHRLTTGRAVAVVALPAAVVIIFAVIALVTLIIGFAAALAPFTAPY